ncbi:MAG: sorbosone dehydrogenase family protein [Thermomicrobiales bacterium]
MHHAGRNPGSQLPTVALWLGALAILLAACGGSGGSAAPPATTAPVASPATTTIRVPQSANQTALTEEHTLTLPSGFQIAVFAAGMSKTRFLAWSPEGDLVASDMASSDGKVYILPDRNHDGTADDRVIFARGLENPHGLAFHDGFLYIAEEERVIRLPWRGGQPAASSSEVVIPNLPGGGHYTRTIGFGPDGKLYLSIGSSCNVCDEQDDRRAAIVQYNADGSGGRVYAKGLRNAVGFVWRPGSDELWATNNGRDGLGDDIPPETINLVRDGNDFGWPYCHNGRIKDKEFGRLGSCDKVTRPAFEMQAHSAPLGLTFYSGSAFPADYNGDLFVAFHGSWNRTTPTGYKVIRARFANGQPTGKTEDFITGWLGASGNAWGRPVDVSVGPDGNLYITDDALGIVYRVSVAGR